MKHCFARKGIRQSGAILRQTYLSNLSTLVSLVSMLSLRIRAAKQSAWRITLASMGTAMWSVRYDRRVVTWG